MDKNKAIKFVLQNARPLELAVYKYFFENEKIKTIIADSVFHVFYRSCLLFSVIDNHCDKRKQFASGVSDGMSFTGGR